MWFLFVVIGFYQVTEVLFINIYFEKIKYFKIFCLKVLKHKKKYLVYICILFCLETTLEKGSNIFNLLGDSKIVVHI